MSEFNKSLKHLKNDNERSNSQKIGIFYELCKAHNIEPVILRLSGDIKNRFTRSGYLITFTNARVIISEKSNFRNLLDIGYIAGLGPYLYYLLSDKVDLEDIKTKDSFVQGLPSDSDSTKEFYIHYKEIEKIVFYHGIDTLITNMLGSAVNYNFLKIHTQKTLYNFNISAKKNGDYEKIFYWLKISLPIKVYKE
jgi:hypothetical protein